MIRMAFVGDVSLGEHYFSFGHGPRSLVEKNRDVFADVKAQLASNHLNVANLEGPISDINLDRSCPNRRVFRGHPASAKQLREAGFNVINVANNHFVQHGLNAAQESVALLNEEDITVIGLAAEPIKYKQIKGVRVALIGCSLIPDNTDPGQSYYFAPSTDELLSVCSQAASQSDVAVLYIHWGKEGDLVYSPNQQLLAQAIHDCGVKILIGHHTHSLQPIQRTSHTLTAYSLGNFVFDLPWSKSNKESTILSLTYAHPEITEVTAHSVTIANSGMPRLTGISAKIGIGITKLSAFNNKSTKYESVYKLLFFIFNLFRGDVTVKLRFLKWKIKGI